MPGNPIDAYQDVEKNAQSGRGLEALILGKAAAMLQDVRNNWDAEDRPQRLDEALRYNQKLWTFLQGDWGSHQNLLPAEIRSNLLSLSVFVDRRTVEIFNDPRPEKLDILVSINNNIAAGLRSRVDVGAAP